MRQDTLKDLPGKKADREDYGYNIGLYFHHQSYPQLGVVVALVLSLQSFWSFSTDLQ